MRHPSPASAPPSAMPATPLPALALALALSLAAAVSLGLTRFSYALLLPPMRADLGWSYLLAGGMNTANAVGYLVGALAMPWLLRRHAPARVLLAGTVLATLLMALCGFLLGASSLLAQRLLAGVASAVVFVAGGVMAARLGALDTRRSGLLLGVFYGGVGWGIAASALLVPLVLAHAPNPHRWAWAWWVLALLCGVCTWVLRWPAAVLARADAQAAAPADGSAARGGVPVRALAPALLGYALFGVGYIGYMTFVIALLQEQGLGVAGVTAFYTLLGLAVVASARVWAGVLERSRGGGALALLNALLGVATVLPAFSAALPVVLVSGVLFGGVFLSLVASTTALVRHNLPSAQWAAGISAFTIVFAAGQIVGPTVVGAIADTAGGLSRGLVFSALALWLGALVAWRQRPLSATAAARLT